MVYSPPVKASGAVQPEHKQSGSINGVKAKDENGAHAETYKIVLCNHAFKKNQMSLRTGLRCHRSYAALRQSATSARCQSRQCCKIPEIRADDREATFRETVSD